MLQYRKMDLRTFNKMKQYQKVRKNVSAKDIEIISIYYMPLGLTSMQAKIVTCANVVGNVCQLPQLYTDVTII